MAGQAVGSSAEDGNRSKTTLLPPGVSYAACEGEGSTDWQMRGPPPQPRRLLVSLPWDTITTSSSGRERKRAFGAAFARPRCSLKISRRGMYMYWARAGSTHSPTPLGGRRGGVQLFAACLSEEG